MIDIFTPINNTDDIFVDNGKIQTRNSTTGNSQIDPPLSSSSKRRSTFSCGDCKLRGASMSASVEQYNDDNGSLGMADSTGMSEFMMSDRAVKHDGMDLPKPPTRSSSEGIIGNLERPASSHVRMRSVGAKIPDGLVVDVGSGNPLSNNDAQQDLAIEEGTPAAEALRANADVHVSKFSKLFRYLNIQNVKKVVKKSGVGGQFGSKRGKPPRVPGMEGSDGDGSGEEGHLSALDEVAEYSDSEDQSNLNDRDSLNRNESGDLAPSTIDGTAEREEHSLVSMNYSLAGQKGADTIKFMDAKGREQVVSLKKSMRRGKKKKKKSDSRKTYVKGKVIDRKHELYTLSIAMMLGLRTSIYLTNDQIEEDKQKKKIWIESNDFMRVEKFMFRPKGGPNTPPHQLSHTFKFKDYSPLAFAYIRRMFGVNEYEFLQSVCGSANFIEFISNAKSGQFFFYSNDGKYMIKTMTNAESKFLRRILPHYFRHCSQNPNTLITKFFGMYRVKLYHLRRNVKFIIMNSVFDTDKPLQSFFDLKGSKIGRDAKAGEDVKKDNDVRKRYPETFTLMPTEKERMRIQVEKDCNFLQEMKIMDYSMLIGVHHVPSRSTNDSMKGLNFRESTTRAINAGSIGTSYRVPTKMNKISRARSDSAAVTKLKTPFLEHPPIMPTDSDGDHKKNPNAERKVEFDVNGEIEKKWLASKVELTENNDFKKSLASPLHPSDRSLTSLSTIEGEDEDENSYIGDTKEIKFEIDEAADAELQEERERMRLRKEKGTEQIYWPFHRFYEINGERRTTPLDVHGGYVEVEAEEEDMETNCGNCLGDIAKHDPDIKNARLKWQLPDFDKPISNRKDKGLVMDTTGTQLPLKISNGRTIQRCDGKIFYMGIIDVLQQFNIRKRIEAKYRSFGKGALDASCVRPDLYADRFVRFFEEYTIKQSEDQIGNQAPGEKETEQVVFS